ncbi:hypothetical protein BDC45DRAFT_542142 [Circinella umbellata]|nr:hypothetical protein BDC45DRAFT_542142 [Circinella umbellata]
MVTTCFVESNTVKLSKALNLIEDLIILESPTTVSDVNDLKRAWKGRSSVTYSIIKNLNLNTVVELDLHVPDNVWTKLYESVTDSLNVRFPLELPNSKFSGMIKHLSSKNEIVTKIEPKSVQVEIKHSFLTSLHHSGEYLDHLSYSLINPAPTSKNMEVIIKRYLQAKAGISQIAYGYYKQLKWANFLDLIAAMIDIIDAIIISLPDLNEQSSPIPSETVVSLHITIVDTKFDCYSWNDRVGKYSQTIQLEICA